jgi:mono/diheme cytochrome c family protein
MPDTMRALALAAGLTLAAWTGAGSGAAQAPPSAASPASGAPAAGPAPPVEFSPEFLADPARIEVGRAVWLARCQFCHGRRAYPGKAPRLEPSRYTPAFVYDRVANGYQGMPAWRQEFSVEQLKSVVAYVLSRDFPN